MTTGIRLGGDAPHPIDHHIGQLMRRRRKELGISQRQVADQLGLSFQQVDKYERAQNRITAAKLWEVAMVLKVNPGFFYEGWNVDAAEIETLSDAAHSGELVVPECKEPPDNPSAGETPDLSP